MLKELIRIMIQEDKEQFLKKTEDLRFSGDMDDPLFKQSPKNKEKAKNIKRIWSKEANGLFSILVASILEIEAVTLDLF